MGETDSLLYYFMSKTIDEVTQDELESLYLENDWDVKKIAEKMGWDENKIKRKFSSFYKNEEKIQELVNKFKIVNMSVLKKLSSGLESRREKEKFTIIFYRIPLEEIIDSLLKNLSFKNISKKYKSNELVVREFFYDYFNKKEDFIKLIETFNIKNSTQFYKMFQQLYFKSLKLGYDLFPKRNLDELRKNIKKLKIYIRKELKCKNLEDLKRKDSSLVKYVWLNLPIEDKLYIFPNLRQEIDWVSYINKFNNKFEAVLYYVRKNNIKTSVELSIRARQLYDIYCFFGNEQKEIIFPGVTSGSGWERRAGSDLQKEFSNCTVISQKKFEDCKNIKQLPFDISLYSPSGKLICLVEIHGATHFTEVHGSFNRTRKTDIIKYEYCKKNNIPLFYFTYDPSLIEKYDYPYYVYTDFEELVQKIKELLQKVS